MIAIDQMQATRRLLVGLGDSLEDSIDKRPPGFGNHPLWNLGHIAVTTRLLVYKLSGLGVGLPDEVVKSFSKGSSPDTWPRAFPWSEIRGLLLAQPTEIRRDYEAGLFKNYERYETSAGVVLDNVDAALSFNSFHDGIHLGYVLAQRKALQHS